MLSVISGAVLAEEVSETADKQEAGSREVQVEVFAEVEELDGIATVLRTGATVWKQLSEGDQLEKGAQISVGADSSVGLKIEGHKLMLSEGALFTVRDLTGKMKFKLWHGSLKAKVKKLSETQSFEVLSPAAVCAVRGTEFDMKVSGDSTTKVATHSGEVSLKDISSGKEVIIKKGQMCMMGPGIKDPKAETIPKKKKKKKEKEPAKEEEPEEAEPAPEKTEKPKPRKAKAAKTAGISVNGSFGADVLTDSENPENNKVYYNLSLMPEISIWRFGIGLDISLYFDEEGNMREREWDDWSDLVEKVWYVRYCQKGDPLFALFGGIKSYTIGHG